MAFVGKKKNTEHQPFSFREKNVSCVYLRRAGQSEQQVKRRLGEVEVVFGPQADLDGAEHRGEDWNLPHHRDPVLPVLIGATQLLRQVQSQHAHLIKQRQQEERKMYFRKKMAGKKRYLSM